MTKWEKVSMASSLESKMVKKLPGWYVGYYGDEAGNPGGHIFHPHREFQGAPGVPPSDAIRYMDWIFPILMYWDGLVLTRGPERQ